MPSSPLELVAPCVQVSDDKAEVVELERRRGGRGARFSARVRRRRPSVDFSSPQDAMKIRGVGAFCLACRRARRAARQRCSRGGRRSLPGRATLRPWRCSMVWMKLAASSSESCVPVSSHAMPRPRTSVRSWLCSRYQQLTSVISSSPRGDGLSDSANADDLPVVEVNARDGVARLRHGGLFLRARWTRAVGVKTRRRRSARGSLTA